MAYNGRRMVIRRIRRMAAVVPIAGLRWAEEPEGDPAVREQTKLMADMKFTCPHCGQDIECDELWSGHEIQCPTCQRPLMVRPSPTRHRMRRWPSAKPGQPRLSIGQSLCPALRRAAPPPPQETLYNRSCSRPGPDRRAARRSGWASARWWSSSAWAAISATGPSANGGRNGARQPSRRAMRPRRRSPRPPAAAAAATEAPPRKRNCPSCAPVWTLDLDKATIPSSKVNGVISGTNFVAETAMCTARC